MIVIILIAIVTFIYWNRKLFYTKSKLEKAQHDIDTYMRIINNNVLISIATTLKKNIRKLDLIGRWGG